MHAGAPSWSAPRRPIGLAIVAVPGVGAFAVRFGLMDGTIQETPAALAVGTENPYDFIRHLLGPVSPASAHAVAGFSGT